MIALYRVIAKTDWKETGEVSTSLLYQRVWGGWGGSVYLNMGDGVLLALPSP